VTTRPPPAAAEGYWVRPVHGQFYGGFAMRGARRAGPRRERQEKRRGATIVIVAVCMVMLIGMVGVGVDFARMYAFKTQLKTVTDAAAMAGAIELGRPGARGSRPQDYALAQAPLN